MRWTRRSGAALSLITALAATSAGAQERIDGFWAINPADCEGPVFDPGGLFIDTGAAVVEYYGPVCAIEAWQPIGLAGFAGRAELVCTGERGTTARSLVFALDDAFYGAGERLVEIDMLTGFVVGRVRCSAE